MVILPGDYQGPLCSGVGLPSSLSVLTLTPGRTWALSSPYLRPGSSHQVPIFSQTCMCDRLSVLVSPQGLPGPTTGAGICGVPSGLTQGPPQSSFRHHPLIFLLKKKKKDKNLKSKTPNSKFFPGAKAPSLGHCTNNTGLAYFAPGTPLVFSEGSALRGANPQTSSKSNVPSSANRWLGPLIGELLESHQRC